MQPSGVNGNSWLRMNGRSLTPSGRLPTITLSTGVILWAGNRPCRTKTTPGAPTLLPNVKWSAILPVTCVALSAFKTGNTLLSDPLMKKLQDKPFVVRRTRKRLLTPPISQSTNQPTNQSTNQPINQSTSYPTKRLKVLRTL